ncbi:Serine/threonine-protein phosphatase 7 long form like [Glycine soja]|uniref:Serine/threonine-protein phosphatase 7 long form like n=1 Tax=Glycine soja TaxID=3848 RepID=A0A0B2PZG2_GLYSO|nr:Serine/threonine-protein phosphatase 7 long form like [Glycine soja]
MRKSTRISAIGLSNPPEGPEPTKPFSTRFSLRSYAKRVQLFTPQQRSAVSRTGFGNLLLVPNHTLLNKVFLTELMDAWSRERRPFVLRSGEEIPMTLLDAALILGLPVAGNPVSFTEEEPFSDLEESYGATKAKRKVAMSFLENRLDWIGEDVSEDFVRCFLLYTIGTFLASNDGKVDSRFLRFFEDLDEVSGFAWGAAVVDDLCQWLDKRKEHNVRLVRPQLQDHDLTFPRVCRWDNTKSKRGTSWFKDLDDDQVIWKLEPTSGELQIEVIKEALDLLGDNKELQSVESSSISTPSSLNFFYYNAPDVNSGLQLSIEKEVHRVDEDDLENQVVEDTPTKLSTCDEEYREQINPENLMVLDTPPDLTICDKVGREQEMNLENLAVVVEDTPTTTSIADKVGGDQEVNSEKLIVEDTPLNYICDKVCREQEMNLENLEVLVDDAPTTISIANEGGGDQEFNGEKLIVEDTPPELSFYDDDITKKNVMLEVENTELKMKIDQVMEENELLYTQILSNTRFEEQNNELKKELDLLREENRILRLSISSFADRIDRHILDFESNATK